MTAAQSPALQLQLRWGSQWPNGRLDVSGKQLLICWVVGDCSLNYCMPAASLMPVLIVQAAVPSTLQLAMDMEWIPSCAAAEQLTNKCSKHLPCTRPCRHVHCCKADGAHPATGHTCRSHQHCAWQPPPQHGRAASSAWQLACTTSMHCQALQQLQWWHPQ